MTRVPSKYDYVKYDDVAVGQQEAFKHSVEKLDNLLVTTFGQIPEDSVDIPMLDGSTVKSALTQNFKDAVHYLEIAYMKIGKAIRDQQILRNGAAELQEERTDS